MCRLSCARGSWRLDWVHPTSIKPPSPDSPSAIRKKETESFRALSLPGLVACDQWIARPGRSVQGFRVWRARRLHRRVGVSGVPDSSCSPRGLHYPLPPTPDTTRCSGTIAEERGIGMSEVGTTGDG